jgi:hypothetical protein
LRCRFFCRKYSNIVFTTPVSEAIRLKQLLEENPHLETDPLIAYGAGEKCDILVDVKRDHVGGSVEKTVGAKVEKTTHIVSRYEGFLPTRKKKAWRNSIIFVVATFGSIVLADSGITVYLNAISIPTLLSWTFVSVLLKAVLLALGPTGVAFLSR